MNRLEDRCPQILHLIQGTEAHETQYVNPSLTQIANFFAVFKGNNVRLRFQVQGVWIPISEYLKIC